MPGLDYKGSVPPSMGGASLATVFGRTVPRSFYDGTPGRELVTCPDCGRPADALFSDHGGTCSGPVTARSALGIIRAAALEARHVSMNECRAAFDRAGIKPTARGPAFAEAVRRGWLEADGTTPSTDPRTKGHHVKTYRSTIHPAARAAERTNP